MKFLILLAAMVSLQIHAAPALSSDGAYELNKRSGVDRKHYSGTKLYDAQQMGTKGQWDYSKQGGAIGSINLLDHDGKPVTLPANAVITNCLIDEATNVTGDATVAITASSSGDLKAAAAASGYSGRMACIPDGTTTHMIKLSAEKTLKIEVASEALTAGKLNVWVEYVLSD